jgi:virginiamycin B lyase
VLHRPPLIATALVAASLLVACTSASTLHKIQLHTPLSCPCPTIAPLATYQLPGEALSLPDNVYLGSVAPGPDGNLWVPELDANMIARVTLPGGAITEFPVPTANAMPYLMSPSAGSDGNMWFTEANAQAQAIGRITMSGVITEFPLPPPLNTALDPQGDQIEGIAPGPDGNLWFAHGGANLIGVINTSGQVLNTYPIPTADSQPDFIIAGPDNNMWFSEALGNKIGRITMSGVITEFSIPTPNSHPHNLVLGADGNLWFPEAFAGNIARITLQGIITEFPVVGDPTTVRLARITTTADGSLWFTEPMIKAPVGGGPWTSEIGKMNTDGVETDLWSFPGGKPWALATGPDGNPWFTNWADATINRL